MTTTTTTSAYRLLWSAY